MRASAPRSLRAFLMRIRGLWSAASREPDLREEFAHDLALMIEDNQRRGLTPSEARRIALVQLGGLEKTMQAVRDRRTLPSLEELLQDIRFAMRQFRRRPGFTLAAILTLAIGFAASTTIFAFVDAAMLQPLPFYNPQQLVFTTETAELMGPANLSWQDYEDWKRQATSFSSLAAWRYLGGPMRIGDQLVPEPGIGVSGNFLGTLGVHPQLGRDFTASDNLAQSPKVLMLSDELWRNSFHADPSILNRAIEIGGDPYIVIGVLPKAFQFAPRGRLQFMTAVVPGPNSCEGRRYCHSLLGLARLRDGVTVAQADAEVKQIAKALEAQYPDSNRGQGGVVMPLTEQITGKIRPILYTLLSAALLLCAIACINVASLLLARSENRRREFALRSALGATHHRMLRQFAVESAALVFAGSIAGTATAAFGVRLLMLLVPQSMRDQMSFLNNVNLNRDTCLFAAAVAIVTFFLFTLVPDLRVSWKALQRAITEGSASAGAGSLSWRRLGSLLVIAEVAVSIVLLVGAGLLTRSLNNLLHTDLGFKPDHLVTLSVGLPTKFTTDAQRLAVERPLLDRLAAIPGVTSAGFSYLLPLSFNGNTDWIRFPGRPYDGKHIEINARSGSPTYFTTLQTPLLKGRFFTEQDTDGKPTVVIVNKRFADLYYPGQNPIGQSFGNTSLEPKSMRTIIGVIEDLHEGALDDPIWPAEYYSVYQSVDDMAIVLRTAGSESSVLSAIPPLVHAIDPDLAVTDIVAMNDRIHSSQSATLRRGAAWLASAFAVAALLLCVIGLYGVISYSVSLRTREIGVRMALGASRQTIYATVLREASRLSLTGIIAGLLLSAASATLLRAILFHVSTWDIPTLAGSCLLLLLCSLLAALAPARKAALSDPTEALRAE